MNLAIASIVMASPMGFVRDSELPAIIEADRLCWLLVRCVGCRFSCPAQDISRLLWCIGKGGESVRDISFPSSTIAEAEAFVAANRERPALQPANAWSINRTKARPQVEGQDWICTGNYDGTTCGSDADSGL